MRKSFVLYISDMKLMEKLDLTQRGTLITAIAAYVKGEELPDMDPVTDMLFSVMAEHIDRDGAKYDRKVERLRENVSKSNRNRNDIGSVAVADAVAVAVADKDIRAKRGRNKRPAEQHDYDWKQIDADLLRRQREGLGT
jgi:hypothetical protein